MAKRPKGNRRFDIAYQSAFELSPAQPFQGDFADPGQDDFLMIEHSTSYVWIKRRQLSSWLTPFHIFLPMCFVQIG